MNEHPSACAFFAYRKSSNTQRSTYGNYHSEITNESVAHQAPECYDKSIKNKNFSTNQTFNNQNL